VIDLPDPAGGMRLVVVRHTEPVESAAGRCYGSLDVELSAAGLANAARLGDALSWLDPAGVYTSPRVRAADAALAIGAPLGLEPIVVPGLRELDFGELEGRAYDDIRRERPELYRRWMQTPTTVRFPGGEGFEDLRRRAIAAVDEIRAAHPGSTALVVTHGGVARAVLAEALGMRGEAIFTIDQRYGAVNVIDWYSGRPLVRLVNGSA
jgi:broad specificity phosphatase PhoE